MLRLHSKWVGLFLGAAFLTLAVLLGGARAPVYSATDPTLLHLKELHQGYVAQYAATMEKMSRSGDSNTYYIFSYYLHGMLSGVEATGNEAELKQVMHYLDNMLAAAQDLNKDGIPQWKPLDKNGRPVQLAVFQGIGPVARAAAIIMRNPGFKARYQAQAARYIEFTDQQIFRYWLQGTYGGRIPWLPKAYGGWGTYPVWNDKCTHLGMIATFLYQATGKQQYLDVATRIGKAFKDRLRPNGQGWIWDADVPGESWTKAGYLHQAPKHDTSHANREPMMIVFMHEAGIVFSAADLDRMAHTLTDTIWNGSTTDPRFANYIDGGNDPFERGKNMTPGSVGAIYSGWAMLGRYSPLAQKAAQATLQAMEKGVRNPSVDYNNSSAGKVELSGQVLRNYALAVGK